MQKISEILSSPTAPAETGARASSRPTTSEPGNWIWSNDERLAGRPGVPEPVPCEFCGALRYHKGIPLGNRILWPPYGAERCTCPEAVAAYEKEKAEREAAEAAAEPAILLPDNYIEDAQAGVTVVEEIPSDADTAAADAATDAADNDKPTA